MIIIAGHITVDPTDRGRYLEAVADVAPQARAFAGCLDFVQAADPIEPGRINIYERWTDDEALHRFRESGGAGPDAPPIRAADVKKYRIAAVESP
ncbi:putative quinol monooxygenase [Virgisporangium aurantiacum]|uniref:Antibiotic biosynthesis monooxygenase n=1 Tax=Virgisporangium aurantiacum TaxID=175570 RepID=A0A8J3ZAN1_9ACTN|nr:antibiotic biosynthesis monooxygenase family protein [Virgisporangium aurantiacum]GIJ59388.1 antibiotic biosynthesis monooxygenase [Virgisporangium aurantiacum]